MKRSLKKIRNINLIVCLVLIVTISSCQEEKNKGSYFGSSQRDDITKLITKEDVQDVFNLSNDVAIEKKVKKDAITSYDWESPETKNLFYSIKLNFSKGNRRSRSEIDEVWETQDKFLEKHNPQEISDIGDKASWSEIGGGQLRVAANGYIFFVSFYITPKKDNPLMADEMINKTKALAEKVIKRM